MKLSQLRSIIKEEVNKYSTYSNTLLTEGLVDKIISLILTPKVKRDAEKIKKSTEWKNLQAQIKLTAEHLAQLEKEAANQVKEAEKMYDEAKKYGYKFSSDMSTDEFIQQYSKWTKGIQGKAVKFTNKNFDK
jgi:putative lipoic acid-binding regulatory protein